MKWRANITLAFVTIMMLVPLQAWASTYSVVSRNLGEPAIAFRVDDMRSGRLPARIHERRIPPVFSSQIVLACLGIAAQPEDILVYLQQSRRCMAFEDLPNRVRQTSAHSAQTVLSGGIATQSMAQPEGGNTVILMPAAFSSPAGACICPAPVNNPPVASVLAGSPQQALAAATINQITFQATDAENLSISHSFSYTLDGGLSMNGLPAGLSAVCTPGSGTLTCQVNGTAPIQTGIYVVEFVASDGSLSDSATASITVVDAPLSDVVFRDGFEAIE